MSLDKILSITGKPGLYELKARTRAGFIAESLVDGKKQAVGAHNNVSMLSEIAVYTYTEEVPLREVFEKISKKANGAQTISHKASKNELEAFFTEVLPEYDEDRVYASDIKKIIQWYNLLINKGITDFSEETKELDKSEAAKEEE